MKGWKIKIIFLLIVYLGGGVCKSTITPSSYNNLTKGACKTLQISFG